MSATALPARAVPAWRGPLAWALAALALLAAVLAALAVGRFPIAPAELPAILLGRDDGPAALVFWNIRLPRVAAAMLVGACLAAAGAAFQGMFRNPLASPDLLGVSAGASLGAVLGIFLGLPVAAIQGLAFAGGIGAVAAVAALAGAVRGQGDPVLVLILAGIALGALMGSAISLLKILADPYNQLPAITFWLLGTLSAATRGDMLAAAYPALLGLAGLFLIRWRLNLLTLGEDEARALGVNTTALRAGAVACATLCTAAVTALAGVVGWIGLVVPHMARMIGGPDLRRLIPLSTILGAAFLLAIDTVARSVGRMEVPLGILTAVLGTPLFFGCWRAPDGATRDAAARGARPLCRPRRARRCDRHLPLARSRARAVPARAERGRQDDAAAHPARPPPAARGRGPARRRRHPGPAAT